MKMISLKNHRYAGKRFYLGDEFDVVRKTDAVVLAAIGVAKEYTPAPVFARAAPVVRKVMTAAKVEGAAVEHPPEVDRDAPPLDLLGVAEAPASNPVDAPAAKEEDKPKRTYLRRDMTAEGKSGSK